MRTSWKFLPLFLATSLSLRPADAVSARGTGFAIDTDGHIMTAAHVVAGCRSVTARIGGREFPADIVSTDPQNDLALLKIAGGAVRASLPLRDGPRVRLGESVLAFGFPLQGVMTSSINMTPGSVSALAGLGDDARVLQFTAPIQPGNSGGPLVDASGSVVGVVTSRLSPLWAMKNVGTVPENVNFALKASVVRDFLDSRNAEYRSQGLGPASPSTTLAEKVSGAVLPLQCTEGGEANDSASEVSKAGADATALGGPSLKETLDWLKEKIPLGIVHQVTTNCDPRTCVNGIPISSVLQSTVWSLDSCTAALGRVDQSTSDAFMTTTSDRYAFSLGVVTGGSIERREIAPGITFVSGERYGYFLFLTSRSKEISLASTNLGRTVGTYVNSAEATDHIVLIFNDEPLARRVLQAFNHAAELCRKKEPF